MHEKYPKACLTTLGLHPLETVYGDIKSKDVLKDKLDELDELVKENIEHIVGIGECGIDSHYEWDDAINQLQVPLFIHQCKLAREYKLPIVIHSRSNFDLTQEILMDYTDLDIYFHCRWYTPKQIRKACESFPNLWIGFCGNLSYKKAIDIQKSFIEAVNQKAKIVMETDAPYLSPQKLRWTENSPKNVTVMYQRVEETFDLPGEVFTDNAKQLYKL